MFSDFHFLQSGWLLTIPPLLIVWLWRHAPAPDWPILLAPPRLRFPPLSRAKTGSGRPSKTPRSRLTGPLFAAGMGAAILALAQPVINTATVQDDQKAEPVDLILLVGTAVTMNLRDYIADGKRVSRMTMLKQLLGDFVRDYSGRRIALVVLGDPPARWLPLTDDRGVVLNAISRLRTGLGGRLSDTGGALQMIAAQFSSDDENVVVLITDAGLQLGSLSPADGAKRISASGMTLHTIAVGSADPGAGEDNSTGLLYEPVNLDLMQQLATIGHGEMFRALDTDHMRQALKKIETLHRHPAPAATTHQLTQPLYPWAIGLALLFFMLSMAVSQRIAARAETTA